MEPQETVRAWVEVLLQPPYSSDLAPSNYRLFRRLSNHLRGLNFPNNQKIKNDVQRIFMEKPREFYERGIKKARGEVGRGIKNEGDYT